MYPSVLYILHKYSDWSLESKWAFADSYPVQLGLVLMMLLSALSSGDAAPDQYNSKATCCSIG